MPARNEFTFSKERKLSVEQFIRVLNRSGLDRRRPVDEVATIEAMLANADIMVSAWLRDRLIGVSRAISDFSYCTYLSDLAVDSEFQNLGIGEQLVRRTREAAGPGSSLILLAAPDAEGYYPRIGMTRHESCWICPRTAR